MILHLQLANKWRVLTDWITRSSTKFLCGRPSLAFQLIVLDRLYVTAKHCYFLKANTSCSAKILLSARLESQRCNPRCFLPVTPIPCLMLILIASFLLLLMISVTDCNNVSSSLNLLLLCLLLLVSQACQGESSSFLNNRLETVRKQLQLSSWYWTAFFYLIISLLSHLKKSISLHTFSMQVNETYVCSGGEPG